MNWIKQHPAQLSLAAISCGVLAGATALYLNIQSFRHSFLDSRGTLAPEPSIPTINVASLDQAIASVDSPGVWKTRNPETDARLFAGKVYVLAGDKIQKPQGTMIEGHVPYDWLRRHGLDPLSRTVLSEDPDRDGFTTLLEFYGMDAVSHVVANQVSTSLPDDSTSPVDPASHPPYHTRLALNRIETIPFRLVFMTADVDPKDAKNSRMQINMLDLRMPSQFVRIGEDIAGTNFSVQEYQEKSKPGPDGTTLDVSELTILSKKTGETVVLPKGVVVDSPESFAIVDYLWSPDGARQPAEKARPGMRLRKGETFSLPPAPDKSYRITDIRGQAVEILLPSGQKHILQKQAH